MMKIYTRGGDEGETSLLAGERVPKYHLRVETYGTFDELNSWLGYVRAINKDSEVESALAWLQPHLHVLCSDVAAPYQNRSPLTPLNKGGNSADVLMETSPLSRGDGGDQRSRIPRLQPGSDETLEQEIDRMEKDLTPLTHFILPGGGPVGAALHVARTVCRRGERCLTELISTEGQTNPETLKFVNRLSDYLFTLARWANNRADVVETVWEGME